MPKAVTRTTTRKKIVPFQKDQSHPYDRLPFTFNPNDGSGRVFWAPRSTGDYNDDCDLGAQYAEAVIPMLRTDHNLLGFIVLGILRDGDKVADRGLVVGFMMRLSQRLITGPARQLRAICALAAEMA